MWVFILILFYWLKMHLAINWVLISIWWLCPPYKTSSNVTSSLTGFASCSTELNWGRYHIKQNMGNIYGREKNYYIWNYMEIILSPSRHSLYLQRYGLPDKIWIISNTFRWNEECDLLRIVNKSPIKFSAQSQLFIRYSAIEGPVCILKIINRATNNVTYFCDDVYF